MVSDFYLFLFENMIKKKIKVVWIMICVQVMGVVLFCLGLVVGFFIGIYGFNGVNKNESGYFSFIQSKVVGQNENRQIKFVDMYDYIYSYGLWKF